MAGRAPRVLLFCRYGCQPWRRFYFTGVWFRLRCTSNIPALLLLCGHELTASRKVGQVLLLSFLALSRLPPAVFGYSAPRDYIIHDIFCNVNTFTKNILHFFNYFYLSVSFEFCNTSPAAGSAFILDRNGFFFFCCCFLYWSGCGVLFARYVPGIPEGDF